MSDASSSAKHTALERLRSFANDILEHQTGSLDGCDIQGIATKHGLLEKLEMAEPCGESCECAMLADFPLDCYRRTALVLPETGAASADKPYKARLGLDRWQAYTGLVQDSPGSAGAVSGRAQGHREGVLECLTKNHR